MYIFKNKQRRRDLEYEIRKDKKSMAKENNKDRILKLLKECKNTSNGGEYCSTIKYSEKHSEWNFK